MQHTGKLRNMASVYLQRGSKILLLYRQGNSIVKNLWIGSAGGHFEQNELNDARACVLRELFEELKITPQSLLDLSLRYITVRYFDGEIRQNYYFFAHLGEDVPEILPSTEGLTQWFSCDELVNLPMPITARYVIDHYCHIGCNDQNLYGGIANNGGITFYTL